MKRILLLLFIIFRANESQEKRFVIDICSYNNAQWYQKNLDSVFMQDYESYRVIYTDDASPDGTGKLVEQYIKENELENRTTLIQNTTRRRALANHYRAIHLCDDDEIILTLDGDDWLADKHVLKKLNELYSSYDIWFAYSCFVNWPKPHGKKNFGSQYSRPIPKKIIDQQAYRYSTWVCGQLRTFYAWLAKSIKLEDLILSSPLFLGDLRAQKFLNTVEQLTPTTLAHALQQADPFQGTFFPSACDVALMLPMLEMTGGRFAYIDEPIYIRNIATDLNDHKVDPSMQKYCARYVRTLRKYESLHQPVKHQARVHNQAASVIVYYDGKSDLESHLLSIQEKLLGIHNIYVIGNNAHIKQDIKGIKFIDSSISSVKETVDEILKNNSYLVFTSGCEKVLECIDLSECIKYLEQTYAAGFYFTVDVSGAPHDQLFDSHTYFWQHQYAYPRSSMVLFRTLDVMRALQGATYDFSTISSLVVENISYERAIGLFFKPCRVRNTYAY